MDRRYNLVDTSWELSDPNPDIFSMFVEFNREFFDGKLGSVEVKWSKRMTLCAGLCRYTGRMGLCTVVLSEPLLKLRPRKDLVETLLHEMIHAYLFVADGNREHDAHGPKFQDFMHRINRLTGTNITIYHSFHDEVNHYKTHWWKCGGPCQSRPPFFGIVKRSMNRKPGPNDFWFKDHQATCGGTFVKIREPEAPPKKPAKAKPKALAGPGSHKIDEYFKTPSASQPSSTYTPTSSAASGSRLFTQPSTSSMPKNPVSKSVFPPFASPKPKNTNSIKRPGAPGSSSAQPKFPTWKPKPVPAQDALPNNGKENKSKTKTGFKGGSNRGGTATAGGSRTVTVITLDDGEGNTDSGSRTINTNSNIPGFSSCVAGGASVPGPRGGLVNTNINISGFSSSVGGSTSTSFPRAGPVNTNSNISGFSTSVAGGAVCNPEGKKPTGFVPFSGKGYALGGGSSSPDKKRPRNYY